MGSTVKAARYTKGKDRFYHVDGEQLPSVTSILQVLGKPALVNWAGKLNRERAAEEAATLYSEMAETGAMFPAAWFRSTLFSRIQGRVFHNEEARAQADIGTVAHERCEWSVKKKMGAEVSPQDPISGPRAMALPIADRERALWASIAFDDWMAKNRVEPIATEIVVAHRKYGYAGTADLVARVNGAVSLIDLKTSSGIWPEMRLQVAAYRAALNSPGGLPVPVEMTMPIATTAHIVRLPKKVSDPEFEAVEVGNLDAHMDAFLSLLNVWKWSNEVSK
jgi:hypothetical protein